MPDQFEGQQIGRYLIRRRLGGGGVATVYQADDQVSGQVVALKLLPLNPDADTLDRFRREALLAGGLHHPHIVRILQVGPASGNSPAYIAMDLVEGESLATLLSRVGQLGAEDSCRLLEPVARALAFAHSHGVIHRDVKPSNILLRPVYTQGSAQHPDQSASPQSIHLESFAYAVVPLLSDFGIARFLDAPELTNMGRTVGTPAFMAPEQCMGSREVDGRADIYALGTVLYRCVTGRLPFRGTTTQILHAHVFEPVVIDDDIAATLPAMLVEILRRTLAKSPEDRYQAAGELADELAAVGSVESSPMQPTGVEATSTMTLAQLPQHQPTAPKPVQILVAATNGAHSPVGGAPVGGGPIGAAHVKTNAGGRNATRPRGPKLERVLWAAFFAILIVGGGLWSARSWMRALTQEEPQDLTLLPVTFVTFTPTPVEEAPPAVAQTTMPVASMEMTPVASATMPAVVVVTTTPMPTQTPTPLPTLLPSATPEPAAPTPLPVLDPPTPTASSEPTSTAMAAPTEEVAGACAMVVDEFFLQAVGQLSGELQADFACPTAPARALFGEWLAFERGVMVALEGEPLVYVYYENGTWEQVSPGAAGDSQAEVNSALPMPFATILAAEGRHLLLGEVQSQLPVGENSVVQPFGGGVALGNRGSGQILFLARSTLRF